MLTTEERQKKEYWIASMLFWLNEYHHDNKPYLFEQYRMAAEMATINIRYGDLG